MKAIAKKNFNSHTQKTGHPDIDSHSGFNDECSHTPDHPIKKGRFILSDLVENRIPSPKPSQQSIKIFGKKFLSG